MDAVVEPEPPGAEPAPAPAPASPTQPQSTNPAETALEHEVRIATRNGRWALIAALCAAIVSGAVSAGSAIYVNTNQLDRSANLAAEQTIRADRHKAYLEFLNACSDYLGQVGVLKGGYSLPTAQIVTPSNRFSTKRRPEEERRYPAHLACCWREARKCQKSSRNSQRL
jgi:hypothetical protein